MKTVYDPTPKEGLALGSLVIDRSEWGPHAVIGYEYRSSMFNPQSKRSCCLGLLCRAVTVAGGADDPKDLWAKLGLPTENLSAIPDSIRALLVLPGTETVPYPYTDFVGSAAAINDRSGPSAEMVEAQLIALFAAHGIGLSFVGELIP